MIKFLIATIVALTLVIPAQAAPKNQFRDGDIIYSDSSKRRGSNSKCLPKAKEYVNKVPEAVRILDKMREYRQEKFFWRWIDCHSLIISVATAVHESIHFLGAKPEGFYLLDGMRLSRITGNLPRPDKILRGVFPKKDGFVTTYMGLASSREEFDYLLDELVAYTYDTQVSLGLRPYLEIGNSYRDGLSSLMAFTMAYVNRVNAKAQETIIKQRNILEPIWRQAEQQFSKACAVEKFAVDDSFFVRFLYNKNNHKGLEKVLDRTVQMPQQCTKALVK